MNTPPNRDWLDALSDGSLFRSMLALFVQVFLGGFYLALLAAGYAAAIGLSFVLIGIPLLLFVLSSTRVLANVDRRMMAIMLGIDPPETPEDLDLRGANIGERLGMLLGSGITWRSLFYLLLRLPIGIGAIAALMLILPFAALEMLILAPLGIDMRLLTVRLMRGVAMISYHASAWVLPVVEAEEERRRPLRAKQKRARLEDADDPYEQDRLDDAPSHRSGETVYALGSDGELYTRRRRG
jgi:hypothetical protein